MVLSVSDVLESAESARDAGHLFLCAELLKLAEDMIPGVDGAGSALSRLALEEVRNRMPIGAVVGDVCDAYASRELRHVLLEGAGR